MQRKSVRSTIFSTVALVILLLLSIIPSAVAQDEEPIRVGSTLALTGPFSPTATLHHIAGQAFVAHLNEQGGLLGRPVEWIVFDDESSADNAAALYERLITEEEVDLLMGPYATAAITAGMNVAARYGMVFPHHTASLTYVYDYEWHFPAWHVGLNTHITTNQILFDALENAGIEPGRIAVVTNQAPGPLNVAFGNDVQEPGGAAVIAGERGWEVVLEVEYPVGTTDFGPIAAQIRDADPDFLWVGAIGADGVNLIEALEALDYRPPTQFYLFPAPGPLLDIGEPADGAYSVTLFEEHEPFLSSTGAADMVELYHAAAEEAGVPPSSQIVDVQVAASWAAWQTLVAGVEGAGSLDQEEIANWLLENGVDTVIGHLGFDPEQNNYSDDLTRIKQIQNGRWVVVWPTEFAAPDAEANYVPGG
jgi:branched-chain amino acid transport system substrate-binding protein